MASAPAPSAWAAGASFGTPAEAFDGDGFVVIAQPLVPADLLAAACERMDAVRAGEHRTPPRGLHVHPADSPTALVKIDQPHTADPTLRELLTHPAIGRFAADITGAETVQLWASQLLFKPPAGKAAGNVGWHQDNGYWKALWDGEVFTVWLAVSDVTEEMGPLRYVRGSHRWGDRDGDFFSRDLDGLKQAVQVDGQAWEEVAAVLPAGGVAAHGKRTLHGSGPNRGAAPRRGFALHLRTERATPNEPALRALFPWIDDDEVSPVIFERTTSRRATHLPI